MAKGRKTGGRQKGTPNKVQAFLKDQILQALEEVHPDGAVGYLKLQAMAEPVAFMGLIGKVLPTQVNHSGEDGGPINVIQRVIVDPAD